MAENKNINKIAKSAFEKFNMEPPQRAWDRIESELDRHQDAANKIKSHRIKYLSITIVLLLLTFFGYQLLNTPVPIISDTNIPQNSDHQNANSNNESANINTPQISGNPDSKIQANSKKNEQSATNRIKPAVTSNGSKNKAVNSTVYASTNLYKAAFNTTDNDHNHSGEQAPASLQIKSLSTDSMTLGQYDSLTDPINSNFVHTIDTIENKNVKPSPFSIAAYFSPNYSWLNLKDNSNNNIDDVAMYNSRENPMFSFTAGIDIGYELNQKLSVVSGVYYTRNARSMSVPTLYALKNSENEMYIEYSTSNGVIEVPMDHSHASMIPGDSITSESKGTQFIKTVSLPLLVRYSIHKTKTTCYLEGGLTASLLVQSKAKMKIDNHDHTVINRTNGLNNTYYGFSIGFGITRNFKNNFGLFAKPVFKGALSSVTKNAVVKTYPYSLGLNVGVHKHF